MLIIYLDGQYEDCLDEWLDSWYHNLDNAKPTADHEKIGATPEEALSWWMRTKGFAVAEA